MSLYISRLALVRRVLIIANGMYSSRSVSGARLFSGKMIATGRLEGTGVSLKPLPRSKPAFSERYRYGQPISIFLPLRNADEVTALFPVFFHLVYLEGEQQLNPSLLGHLLKILTFL